MRWKYFCLSFLWILCACSPTRRLTPGQKLLEAPEIRFTEETAVTKKKAFGEELAALARPRTNSPFKLWVYNLFQKPRRQKGFLYWLKYKVGEEPVLFNASSLNRNRLVLEKHLRDHGYLNAEVQSDTIDKEQKVKVVYQIRADKKYHIREVCLPDSNSVLGRLTGQHQERSFLKAGQVYRAGLLRQERDRLTALATQNGYFGVTQNDVYFYIDTAGYVDSLDLYVRWKPAADSTRLRPYRLGKTTVYPTYSLTDTLTKQSDTLQYEDLKIVESTYFIKESLLNRAIRGQTGDLYDSRLQTSTLRYLQDLDVFKFINLRTETRWENGSDFLDRYFYLTPAQVRDMRFDFEANTRSGSYLGILTATTYTNKNQFNGAERLDLSLSVGAETQLGSDGRFLNTLELTAGATLSIPRLLLPLKSKHLYQDYVNRTRFSLSNAYQIRAGFFTINRLGAEVTYDWRSNRLMRHLWTPITITQNNTFNISPEFAAELEENSRLKNSLEDVLILGGQYRFIYSTQEIGQKKPYLFLTGTVELAGNLPNAVANAIGSGHRPHRIFGTPFSQYLNLQADGRYYFQYSDHTWAIRLAGGVVIPYGNADIVPYSKQFFIGGSNSLRAFRLRQLGPGAFVNPAAETVNFFDQTGEVKLELNAEYRFDLASYFKGAVFVDAGNIWLLNDTFGDSGEGAFQFDVFYREIAVGTGLGLRIDFEYFVIRFDAAFPVRQPILGKGMKWTFNRLDFLSRNWRRQNLVGHLAIGYPF